MSIHADCGQAVRRLLADPSLCSADHPGLFTELDVIALAATGYSDVQVRLAMTKCSTLLTKLYARGKVVRFGPVEIPGLDPDYARIASKIVYAHPEGPAVFETPNGAFPRITGDADWNLRPGRRLRTNRDDRTPWSEQEIEEARARAVIARATPTRRRSRAG